MVSGPPGPSARTPATRPPSRISSVASVRIRSSKCGERPADLAMKSRKSHCGIRAMNLQRVGRWRRSAIVSCTAGKLHGEPLDLLVRQPKQLVEQAELGHDLERRWVERVATKVAQEVGVLLQNHDVDPAAREQEAQHHAGRPAPDDAAARDHAFHCGQPLASSQGRGNGPKTSPIRASSTGAFGRTRATSPRVLSSNTSMSASMPAPASASP